MHWDLIDNFEVLEKGVYARGLKAFKGNEDFFVDHFPQKPLVPDVLFVEMIAQVGGVLFGFGFNFQKEVILAKIGEAKFNQAVTPPCQFVVEAKIDSQRQEGAWISGTVKINSKEIASARILLVTMDFLEEGKGQSVVFNDEFIKHYDIYAVAGKG